MPRFVFKPGKRKEFVKKKVATYDTTLMLTLKDVLPEDPQVARSFLVKKSTAPAGKLRDIYHTKSNSALLRKIFVFYLKAVLIEVCSGKCQYIWPSRAKNKPRINMTTASDKFLKFMLKIGRLRLFDFMQTDYKLPYLAYQLSNRVSLRDPLIYVNKHIYLDLVDRANSGKGFSQRPREIDDFLPVVFEEFSYIKEANLRSLILYCSQKVHRVLKDGEELRILDGDGEIRFFRRLGRKHDSTMAAVARRRLTRLSKQYESNA